MKSFKPLVLFIAVAALLPAQNEATANAVKAEDLKTSIGQSLASAMTTHGLELFQASIKTLQGFYDEMLAKVNLEPAEISEIKSNKANLGKVLEELPSMDVKKYVRAIENLMLEHSGARKFRDGTDDKQKSAMVTELYKKCSDELRALQAKFIAEIEKKWKQLYASLPAAELAKHEQYGEINEILLQIKEAPRPKGPITLETLKRIVRFFDYEHFKFILEPKTTGLAFVYFFNMPPEAMQEAVPFSKVM